MITQLGMHVILNLPNPLKAFVKQLNSFVLIFMIKRYIEPIQCPVCGTRPYTK